MNNTNTSNRDSSVTQNGGLTRVIHGTPEVGMVPANETQLQTRVQGTVHRFVGGVQVEAVDVTRHSEGGAPQHNGSIMATMQKQGPHRTVELIPGNPSSRTRLEIAARDGLVREVSQGIFVDAAPTQLQPMPAVSQQQQPATPQGGTEEAPFSFVDANDMKLWNEDVAPVSQHAYDSAVASVVALAAGGNGSLESVANRLAASEGMEPEQAMQYVNEGAAFYKDSLSRDLIKSVGLPKSQIEPFYNWCRSQPQLNKALSTMMHGGNTAEFRAMALDYKRQSAASTDTSAFKAAGMETSVDRATGELMVRKGQGRWVKASEL